MKSNTTIKNYFLTIFVLVVGAFSLSAQEEIAQEIKIRNGSFEDTPHFGRVDIIGRPITKIFNWIDCGGHYFKGETPPDIHPNPESPFWGVTQVPSHGETYTGMVVRATETWECQSTRLEPALTPGKCYRFSVDLCTSKHYVSKSVATNKDENFTTPVVLRMWGSMTPCSQNQLLSETIAIQHHDWKTYVVEFEAENPSKYLLLEVYYKTPVLIPYHGNILVDNVTNLSLIPCEEEELLALSYPKDEKPEPVIPPHKRKTKKEVKKEEPKEEVIASVSEVKKEPEVKKPIRKRRILKELDRNKIKKGQKINIDDLYFKADTSSIASSSYPVLNELYAFLKNNPDVSIELGGHTNNLPKPAYCDYLSTARAREVAKYLIAKGIDKNRVQFKGYGKRQPIASNNTPNGRKKNQRVEIKILTVDG